MVMDIIHTYMPTHSSVTGLHYKMDENQELSRAALFIVASSMQRNHSPTLFLFFLLLFLHLALFHVAQFGLSDASSITDGLQEAGTTV